MESSGQPGVIHLSEQAAALLDDTFDIEERGMINVKGKGEMKTYWLLGRRDAATSAAPEAERVPTQAKLAVEVD